MNSTSPTPPHSKPATQTEALKEGDKILIEATIRRVDYRNPDPQDDLLLIVFPDWLSLPAGQSHIYVRRRSCRPFTQTKQTPLRKS